MFFANCRASVGAAQAKGRADALKAAGKKGKHKE